MVENEEVRFYICDGGLFDVFTTEVVPAGLQIFRRNEVEEDKITHDLSVTTSEADEALTICLTKDMLEQLYNFIGQELQVLKEKE